MWIKSKVNWFQSLPNLRWIELNHHWIQDEVNLSWIQSKSDGAFIQSNINWIWSLLNLKCMAVNTHWMQSELNIILFYLRNSLQSWWAFWGSVVYITMLLDPFPVTIQSWIDPWPFLRCLGCWSQSLGRSWQWDILYASRWTTNNSLIPICPYELPETCPHFWRARMDENKKNMKQKQFGTLTNLKNINQVGTNWINWITHDWI